MQRRDCDESLDLGNGVAIDFVNISAGTFTMGSPSTEVGRSSNEDQHEVTLTNDFLVSTTEVTQGMYSQLMGYDAHTYSTAYGSNTLRNEGICKLTSKGIADAAKLHPPTT